MRVEHRGGDKFDINVRGHVVRVDQPVKDGGEDTAPTPTELFIASLASCVAFYARRYLARHDLPTDGLAVEATFEMGSKPARVAGIDMRLIVPEGVPAERLDALLAVATHCTVHNTLVSEPEVSITLADAPAAAPGSPCGLSVLILEDGLDDRLASRELQGPGRELGKRLLVAGARRLQGQVGDDLAVTDQLDQQWPVIAASGRHLAGPDDLGLGLTAMR